MGDRIVTYFSNGAERVISFIPSLFSALVILVVGYIVSRLLASGSRRLLHRVGFDRFVGQRVHQRLQSSRPSLSVGATVFWIGMLATFAMASNALGLYALAAGLSHILGFLPRVLVAAVIVIAGIALGNLVARLIGEMASGWVARAARVAITTLTVFMALDEMGIAHSVVMTTFSFLLGAAAVAVAIAFGIGNIGLAGELGRRWTRRAGESFDTRDDTLSPPDLPVSH